MDEYRRSRRPKIVVGIDGSPGCRAAIEFAVQEAELRNAELVAVMAAPPGRHEWSHPSAGGTCDAAEQQLRFILESVGTGALGVDLVVTTRPVTEALVDRSRHADLLVVGGHSDRNGPALAVDSGSLNGAGCPVVVVHSSVGQGTDPDLDNVARYI